MVTGESPVRAFVGCAFMKHRSPHGTAPRTAREGPLSLPGGTGS